MWKWIYLNSWAGFANMHLLTFSTKELWERFNMSVAATERTKWEWFLRTDARFRPLWNNKPPADSSSRLSWVWLWGLIVLSFPVANIMQLSSCGDCQLLPLARILYVLCLSKLVAEQLHCPPQLFYTAHFQWPNGFSSKSSRSKPIEGIFTTQFSYVMTDYVRTFLKCWSFYNKVS